MTITHAFVNPKADGGDAAIARPSDWNAAHVIADETVTYAKMQHVSATDKVLGRSTAGAGDVEEIACTAAGRALIGGATAADQRTTLGLAAIAASGSGADLVAATVPRSALADRSGIADIMQPSIARDLLMGFYPVPGTNNHTAIACTLSVLGTTTARVPAVTSMFTAEGRLGFVSAAGAGSLTGPRVAALRFWRGDAAGLGGWHYVCRFGISDAVLVTDARMFVGLWGSTGAPTNVEPSSLTNILGVGCDASDTELQLYAAGGAAQARASLGALFPVDTISTDLYELAMYAAPNGSTVLVRVERLNTGDVYTTTISNAANLPAATQLLAFHAWRTNNATAAAVGLDIAAAYIGR